MVYAPGTKEVWYRVLLVLGAVALGWLYPSPWREGLWVLAAAAVRRGCVEAALPVRLAGGRICRGRRCWPVSEVEGVSPEFCMGLWPQIRIELLGGGVLPVAAVRGWHEFWDALRRVRPDLPDWRESALVCHFLVLGGAGGFPCREELAKLVSIPLGFRGLAWVTGIWGYALAGHLLPGRSHFLLEAAAGVVSSLAGSALEISVKRGLYCRALRRLPDRWDRLVGGCAAE